MNIYFTAAITSAPESHWENYRKIVKFLEEMGHPVTADHILGKTAEIMAAQDEEEKFAIERQMIADKNQADLIVAEISYPSFGVGQELEYALSREKPAIALYLAGNHPHILRVQGGDFLQIAEYTSETLRQTVREYVEYMKEYADTRFNFFISAEIEAFLDMMSRKRKLPRAVFLRQLIEDDMRKNALYLREIGKGKTKQRK